MENKNSESVFDPLSSKYFASLPLIMQETIMQSSDEIKSEEDLKLLALGLLNFDNTNNNPTD